MIGERVHRAGDVVRDPVALVTADQLIGVADLDAAVAAQIARFVGDAATGRVGDGPHVQPIDPQVRAVVVVADGDVSEDAVPLQCPKVEVDRFDDVERSIWLDRDVGGEARDDPTLVRCRGAGTGEHRENREERDAQGAWGAKPPKVCHRLPSERLRAAVSFRTSSGPPDSRRKHRPGRVGRSPRVEAPALRTPSAR